MKNTNTTNMMNIDTKRAEEILKTYAVANSSFMTIPKDIIEKAIEDGTLTKIGERITSKNNHNVYYEVDSSLVENTVLMHVRNNAYVIISRYTYCPAQDIVIDTVEKLLKLSFYYGRTTSNRCHIMSGTRRDEKLSGAPGTTYLTRVLSSLAIYGENMPLDSTFDVHHKGDCFDNRQGMTMYIPSSLHRHGRVE